MFSVSIRKINNDYEECAGVIRDSFITVANDFNITRENAPTNPAFAGPDALVRMREKGIELYGAYNSSGCVGFVAIEKADENVSYMERLAVLPEYRHKGLGGMLLAFVFDTVRNSGGKKVSIGIINDNILLKDWYAKHGFIETGIRNFRHLPFEVCFMEKILDD
jgi:ribosomal protein S18 acetylase RimI-like enzyme